MIDQLPGQDAIMAQLRTISGVQVYEGQYLTDGAVPNMDENSLFEPYLTTIFGASYAGASRGIVSEQLNTLRTTVTVYSIAPDDRLSREYLGQVRSLLLGFTPVDGTPLKAFGGYNFVDADLGVNRYVHSAIFSYETNLSYS
jgi:hypothetical protein